MHKIPRRHVLQALAAAVAPIPGLGFAQGSYPERPPRWIVAFAPGGPSDVVARILAEAVGPGLNGHRPVIENRPGGLTVIGTRLVHVARPDGYTIGSVGDPLAINELLLPKIPYSFDEFEYIRGLITMPIVLAVRPDMPAGKLDETLAYLKEVGRQAVLQHLGRGLQRASRR